MMEMWGENFTDTAEENSEDRAVQLWKCEQCSYQWKESASSGNEAPDGFSWDAELEIDENLEEDFMEPRMEPGDEENVICPICGSNDVAFV